MLLLHLEFPRRKAHRRFVLYDIVEEQSAAGENPRQRPSFSASSALTHFAAQAANGYKKWHGRISPNHAKTSDIDSLILT